MDESKPSPDEHGPGPDDERPAPWAAPGADGPAPPYGPPFGAPAGPPGPSGGPAGPPGPYGGPTGSYGGPTGSYGGPTGPYDAPSPFGASPGPAGGAPPPPFAAPPGSGWPAWTPPPGPPRGGWASGPASDPFWTPQPPRRHSISVAVTALLVAVAVVAGIGIGSALPHSTYTATAPSAAGNGSGTGNGSSNTLPSLGTLPGGTGSGSGSGGGNTSGPSDVSAIAAKVDPFLVDIKTDLSYQGEEAAGTGIVLDADGLILTNNHVINGSTTIQVTDIGNKKTYTGTVVGYDESSDVALVQLQGASGLPTARLGNSSSVAVGQKVVAVGNAGGVGGTPTAVGGAVTDLGQSITASDEGNGTSEKLHGLIETNADVQPGDSGGSLVNPAGVVIGMDTAASVGLSFDGGGTQGYAIPIDTALGLARTIAAHQGSSTIHIGPTAFLGVAFTAAQSAGSDTVIGTVIKGTAAARAGLAVNDVITTFAGQHVGSPEDLTKLLVTHHPGDTVSVGWRTPSGQTLQRTVTLGVGPNA